MARTKSKWFKLKKLNQALRQKKLFKSLANIPLIDSDFLTNVFVTGQVLSLTYEYHCYLKHNNFRTLRLQNSAHINFMVK